MLIMNKFKKRLNLRKYLSLLVLTLLFIPFQNCTDGFSTVGVESSINNPTNPNPEPEEPAIVINAPSNLRIGTITETQIQLLWNDNSDNEIGFEIQRATSSSGPFNNTSMISSDLTTLTATGLSANTTYWFRVRATRISEHSDYTSVISATTNATVIPQPAPSAPNNLVGTATSTSQINLTWSDQSNNEQGFYIERRVGSGSFSQIAQVNANITSYSNTGLTENTAYSYRVRAFNAIGPSNYSNTASATTLTSTPPPSSNMKYVFMAQGHLGRTIMSCDGGLTWINDRSDNPSGRCWQGGANDVECDHTPITGRGLDAGDGYFYANFGWGYPGSVRRSADGVNWTTIRSNGNGDGILYYDGQLWSSWGNYNSAFSTNQGQTWTQNTTLPGVVTPLAHRAGNLFFAVSRDQAGLIISQNGGQTWQYRSEFPHGSALHFAYGNNIHLMVGGSSATRSLDNGTTWSRNANAISGSFIGLSFNGTHFVGFTSSARWMSTDGVTWSQTVINNRGSVTLNKPIAYNPETRTYVAVPEFWIAGYADQRALHSTDGITWNQLSTTAFPQGHPITRIVSGPMQTRYCP